MRRSLFALFVIATFTWSAVRPAAALAQTSVAVGSQPFGLALNASTSRAYVANNASGTVSVIDTTTLSVVATIAVGGAPAEVAVDEARNIIYVSNFTTASVSVIDGVTNAVIGTLAPGGLGLAVDPARELLYSTGGSAMAVIDLRTRTVVDTVASGGMNWWGVAVNSTTNRIYLEDLTSPYGVAVLDGTSRTLVTRVALPGETRFGIATDEAANLVYVPNYTASGSLSTIDGATNAATSPVALGSFPIASALDAAGHRLYVGNLGSGTVSVLSTGTSPALVDTLTVGGAPAGAAFEAATGRLYVTNNGGSDVKVVETRMPSNEPPVIDGVAVAPLSPRTNDVLIATVSAHDPNGDPLSFAYQWAKNGGDLPGATGPTFDLSVPGNGDRGDMVTVRVTASDGQLTSSATTSVLLADSAPTASVRVSNSSPATNAIVTATATSADADGDSVSYSFAWKVNGALRKTTTGPSASDSFDLSVAGQGDHGDSVVVEVVASDGTMQSALASTSAVVVNTAPTVSVALNKTAPATKDLLVATATGQDLDNDTLSFTYIWRVNGVVKRTTTTAAMTDSFDLSVKRSGDKRDVVTVTVTASDGATTSPAATASATVH